MQRPEANIPVFDPAEVYTAFNNGEDLQELALSLDFQKSTLRQPLADTLEKLKAAVKAERERLKGVVLEDAKIDMILTLRQEINRLMKLRDVYMKGGVSRESTTEIFDVTEKDILSRQVQTTKEVPATAITNITREIRENRKLFCAILNLADSSAESDEAFERALEEAVEEGAIVRGEKKQDQESSPGSSVPSGQPDEKSSLPTPDRDD